MTDPKLADARLLTDKEMSELALWSEFGAPLSPTTLVLLRAVEGVARGRMQSEINRLRVELRKAQEVVQRREPSALEQPRQREAAAGLLTDTREQRRYETAKAVLSGPISADLHYGTQGKPYNPWPDATKEALRAADALLTELEKEPSDVAADLSRLESERDKAMVYRDWWIAEAEKMEAERDEARAALAREQARLAEIEAIIHCFSEDDGADPIVGKVQELSDCYAEASADFAREQAGRAVAGTKAALDVWRIIQWLIAKGITIDRLRSTATNQIVGLQESHARAALAAQPESAKEEPKS